MTTSNSDFLIDRSTTESNGTYVADPGARRPWFNVHGTPPRHRAWNASAS
jgi:hypothetical protein